MKGMSETPQNLPPLQELQLTPTISHTEIHHVDSSISSSNSPNIDFDTAAFMLMSNDNSNATSNFVSDNTFLNSPKFQNSSSYTFINNTNNQFNNESDPNLKLPSLHLNQHNTPPPFSATTPIGSNFDFDLIGQLLMSPKTNQLIDSSLNTNLPFVDGISNTISREIPISGLNSPNLNGWNFTTSNTQLPIYAPSPTNSIGLMSTLLPKSPVTSSSNTIGLGVLDQYPQSNHNTGLLSNTESMALESFLDSIANEGLKREKKKKGNLKQKDDDLFVDGSSKFESRILPPKNGNKQKVKEVIVKKNSSSEIKKKNGMSDTSQDSIERKLKTKKERQIAHNKTEQKRRNMIKIAFDKLHNMILNSQFDLQVKVDSEQFRKKRKRKAAKKPKTLKKYEVLQRSVHEIQLLVQRNAELYKLLNETETTQKIDEIESDEFTNERDDYN